MDNNIKSLQTDMQSMKTDHSQQTQSIHSKMDSQFQQIMTAFANNSQVVAPLPECHTDNISTGISTLTPSDSKDKRGKRKLNNLDNPTITPVTPGLSSGPAQDETQMEDFDDDDPHLLML